MKYGLLLCSHILTLDNDAAENNSGLFFTSVNQINKGNPDAIHSPRYRRKLAELNLRAGKQSIILSDITAALKFFEHGISFLVEGRWTVHYQLSVDLYDAAAEAALVLEKNDAVKLYTDELVDNAVLFDDSLNCKFWMPLGLVLYTSTLHHNLLNHSALFTFLHIIQNRSVNCCIFSAWPTSI